MGKLKWAFVKGNKKWCDEYHSGYFRIRVIPYVQYPTFKKKPDYVIEFKGHEISRLFNKLSSAKNVAQLIANG